jgi:hypothetical protein
VIVSLSLLLLLIALAGFARAGFSITYPKGPDPTVTEWPEWPDPVTCGGLSFDPVTAFGGPTEAENGSGAPELALRRYLDENLSPQIPKRFWRLVVATETRAEFAIGRLSQGPLWLAFDLADGQWRPAGLPGYCTPRTLRDGRTPTAWTLAPSQRLGKRTTRVAVNLHDGRCRDRRTLASLAEAPEFQQVGGRLVMRIWLESLPPGPHTCPKRKHEPPLVVKLPGRLGDRKLYDGRTYPPRLRQ